MKTNRPTTTFKALYAKKRQKIVYRETLCIYESPLEAPIHLSNSHFIGNALSRLIVNPIITDIKSISMSPSTSSSDNNPPNSEPEITDWAEKIDRVDLLNKGHSEQMDVEISTGEGIAQGVPVPRP